MQLLFFIMLIWIICVLVRDYISIREFVKSVRNTINGKEEEMVVPPNPYKSGAKGVLFIKQFIAWNLFLCKVDAHYRLFHECNSCPYPPSFFYKYGEEKAKKIIDEELAELLKIINSHELGN